MRERFVLKFDDFDNIICYKWQSETIKSCKGTVLIAHGLSEHITRYDHFANFLAEEGYIVLGMDHYHHGESAESPKTVGIVEKYDFIEAVIRGIKLVREEFNELFQKNSCILGHSMGSIATQSYIQRYPNDFDKIILSGTDVGDFKYVLLKLLTSLTVKKGDCRTSTKLVYALTFGSFERKFQNRCQFNWLSVNQENIDNYIIDPLCGASVSDSVYKSISNSLRGSFKNKNIKKVNTTSKIFIFSGKDDPVSAMGKSVNKLYKKYKKANITVYKKLFPGLRHEVLNEKEKVEAYKDILNFLNEA